MKNFTRITLAVSLSIFLASEKNANAQVLDTFNYVSNATQTWTVPCGVTSATVTLWGAGGGGGNWNGVSGYEFGGATGAYYQGFFTGLTAGTVLTLYVPSGGIYSNSGNGGLGGWPGGAQGGNDFFYGEEGGGGGGYAAVEIAGNYYVVAGAGAGGGSYPGQPCQGGAGGATTGDNGGGSCCGGQGYGGNIGFGGSGGSGASSCDMSMSGTFLTGGMGGGTTCSGWYGGGGGGAGYYGGGGGGDFGGGGGGGSSFPSGPLTIAGITFTPLSNQLGTDGSNAVVYAPNAPGLIGSGGSLSNGGNGLIAISYDGLNVIPAVTNITCNGDVNGSITANVQYGAAPYTYSWAPVVSTASSISGLSVGTYTVNVTDNNGCTASAMASITQPNPLNVILFVVNNETCNGGDNAHIASFPSGGSTPYTYTWSPSGGTKDTAYDITAGTYTLTLTDNHGCTASASAGVSQPVPVVVSASTTTNVTCRGGFDGSTTSNVVSGGVPPFTYSWSGGGGTNTFANGLSAGTYTMTVTDNNGCMGTASTVVTQPNALAVVPSLTTPVSCEGGNNGVALATPNGGTGPYTYSWFTSGGTNASASGLSAGTYTVTVNDICGNSATASIAVTQVATLTVSANTSSNALCNGASDGAASSSVSGGSVPYTYSWSGGGGSSSTASGLSSGTYTLTVHDKNGCVSTATTFIGEPAAFSIIKSSVPDDGHCTGSAWVTVSGGTAPYTYSWSNGNTTTAVSNICKGDYCCTITDAHACKDSVCFKIVSDLGIEGISSNSGHISVYPNPNNGQFNLESTFDNGAYQVEIYNILGEKVYSTNLNTMNGGISPINIGNQPNGIYLYRVITDSGELLGDGKLIIQK